MICFFKPFLFILIIIKSSNYSNPAKIDVYKRQGKELSDLNALETALKEKFDDQTLELIK